MLYIPVRNYADMATEKRPDNQKKPAVDIHCRPMAEMEGFEPPDGLTRQLISSQPRYDHFDTSPYHIPNAFQLSRRLEAKHKTAEKRRNNYEYSVQDRLCLYA